MRLKNTSRVGRECARPRRGDYGSTTLMTTTTSMVTSHSMPVQQPYTYSAERYALSVFPSGAILGPPEEAFRVSAEAYRR